MSVITWLKELVLGKNGYEPEVQDAEIRVINAESQSSVDKASTHFQSMSGEFTKLHRKNGKPREGLA
jgi:hypothetical protein